MLWWLIGDLLAIKQLITNLPVVVPLVVLLVVPHYSVDTRSPISSALPFKRLIAYFVVLARKTRGSVLWLSLLFTNRAAICTRIRELACRPTFDLIRPLILDLRPLCFQLSLSDESPFGFPANHFLFSAAAFLTQTVCLDDTTVKFEVGASWAKSFWQKLSTIDS